MAIAEGLSLTSKPGGYSAITVTIATSFVSIIRLTMLPYLVEATRR
jgi:hypothetical protein